MAILEIQVPDIGDFDEVTVIELMVKPGDTVVADQSLITVESDKASMEIPSSHAGVVKSVLVKIGDKVKQGSLVVSLEVAGAAASPQNIPKLEEIIATTPARQAQEAINNVANAVSTTAAVAAPGAQSGPVEIRVPDIGDFKDVSVIELLVKVGDSVKVEQSLMTVESDKAAMEIPSSAAGVVKELKVKLGDKVNIGDLIVVLEGVAGASASPSAPGVPSSVRAEPFDKAQDMPVEAPSTSSGRRGSVAVGSILTAVASAAVVATPAHNPNQAPIGLPHASPSVRKFARELGVPLAEVKGSGHKGRITESDVQGFTRSVMSGAIQTVAGRAVSVGVATNSASTDGAGLGLLPWPKVDFSKFGTVERKDLSRIKKISGANLHRNWVMIPHVTNNDEADITDLEAFRVSTNKDNEKSGVKVTMLAFVIKAVVAALKKFPEFNTSLDGDALVFKSYYNIGFAADTPNGLMVPVLKEADKKGILQISAEMSELAKKARDGKLGGADMQGGCMSISSLGGIGGTHFTPIINAPEVAILGLSKGAMKPVWDAQLNGGAFVPRLMLPLSLSYDHRVIDGASAARFNAYLGQLLGDFRRVIL
jgi:pyruvate dehydrogenase E2 component (dihydrolipoamide acetyltransferase)